MSALPPAPVSSPLEPQLWPCRSRHPTFLALIPAHPVSLQEGWFHASVETSPLSTTHHNTDMQETAMHVPLYSITTLTKQKHCPAERTAGTCQPLITARTSLPSATAAERDTGTCQLLITQGPHFPRPL
ncbi:hypothetical protein P7K49_012218, partial [Saguinus oedipus]